MRGLKVFWCVVLGLLLAAGCGGREPLRKPAEQPVKIAFALAGMNRDGNKTIKKVVDKEKRDLLASVTWLDARNDPAEQQKQLEKLAGQNVKAVVLQPVDPAMAPAQVEQLSRAGIKVVVLDNLPVNTPADGYIAPDHAVAGRLQARFVLEALRRAEEAKAGMATPAGGGQTGGQGGGGGQGGSGQGQQGGGGQQQAGSTQGQQGGQQQPTGAVDYTVVAQLPERRPLNVVILRGDPRDQAAREITAAIEAELQGNKDVSILGVYDHPRWDPASVPATLAEIAGRGERVDVILANDSSLAMAAVEYLKTGGNEKHVLTAGVGASEQASRGLVSGEHDAEVDVNPEMLGQFALEAAVSLARNGHWQYSASVNNGDYSVPARIVPVRLVTAKNAYLLEQRWKELKKTRGQGGGQQQQSRAGQQGGGEEQGNKQGQQDQGGQQGRQGGGQGKTTLRITTRDGKTVEVQIDGEVKKIESEGQQGQQGGQGAGSQGRGGG